MNGLHDALDSVRTRQKELEVYASDSEIAVELKQQFATRHVDVVSRSLAGQKPPGFAVLRTGNGDFLAALGLDRFEALISPDVLPPWEAETTDTDLTELFDFLENTLFSSYDRQQMLAAAREIEERAWRTGTGTLYTGFQTEAALSAQTDVYERLGSHHDLSVVVFLREDWDTPLENVTVVSNVAMELGVFWFVIFDGGSDGQQCALLAEEREPGSFYGFWTYERDLVDELVAYLESTYRHP